jgi:dihydroorotate dehydrogenase
MDAETAHDLTLKSLRTGLIPGIPAVADPALEVTLWNRRFRNPVGLAAGFDKNAAVIGAMLNFGFGFVEAGTVTPKPQAGNPRPRVFREPASESVINAMGFPNQGMETFKDNFEAFLSCRPRPAGVVGINIGMNKGQEDPAKDYRALIRHLGPLADYLVVNISSPNTPGLRDLQQKDALTDLLGSLMEERTRACGNAAPPLLVKLAPDLDERQQGEIAAALLNAKADGVILSNTTLARSETLPPAFAARKGGLSGKLLRERSTTIIHNFYRLTCGKLPIIGLGGVSGPQDAYDKIRAGASLVQLYSALVFRGPDVVREINSGLLQLMKQDGFTRIGQATGADHNDKNAEKAEKDKKPA